MEKTIGNIKIVLISLSLLIVLLFAINVLSIEFLIYYSIALLVLVVLTALGAAVLNLAENPKGGKSVLIGIGALLLFYLIGFALAGDSIDPDSLLIIEGSKQAEAGIYTLYLVILTAVGALAFSSIKRIVK